MKYRIKNSLIGVLTTLIVYGVLFFLQFAVLYYVGIFFRDHRDTLQAAFFILHFFVGLHIINDKRNDQVYKIAFLFTIIVLPVFGAFLYILSKWDVLRRWFSNKFESTKNFKLYLLPPRSGSNGRG